MNILCRKKYFLYVRIKFEVFMHQFLILLLFPLSILGAENVDSLHVVLNHQSGTTRINTLLELANHFSQNKDDSAVFYGQMAFELSENLNFEPGIGETWYILGDFHRRTGKKSLAVKEFGLAADIYLRIDKPGKVAASYYRTGLCFKEMAVYDSALVQYRNAIPLYRDESDKSMESVVLGEIGYIYKTTGDYDQAIDNYQKALKIADEIADEGHKATLLNRIGTIYNRLGNHDKALEYFNAALKIRIKRNDQRGIAGSLNNIGLIYIYRDEYDSGLVYFLRAMEMNEEIGNLKWKSINLNNIGSIYERKKEYEKAIEYFLE